MFVNNTSCSGLFQSFIVCLSVFNFYELNKKSQNTMISSKFLGQGHQDAALYLTHKHNILVSCIGLSKYIYKRCTEYKFVNQLPNS